MQDHLAAIKAGTVTKTNVIGIRKALNANARRNAGWPVSITASRLTGAQLVEIDCALAVYEPLVVGELDASGRRQLASPCYRKRLECVRAILDGAYTIHLRGFDALGRFGDHNVLVYRVKSSAGWFTFRNIPWQSGGDGPEILHRELMA